MFPFYFPGESVPLIYEKPCVDLAPLLGNLGLDAVNVIPDVDTICDCPLMAVFHHKILVEEAERLFGRGCSQPDDKGIEVFEHLSPEMVY